MSTAALTSDQVNFLIYRYLLESGFVHSAYAFGHESYVAKSQIDTKQVPPGALISFIQKGLQYVEMESHVNEDGTENVCDTPFSVVDKHTCSSTQRKQIFDPYEAIQIDYGELEIDDDEVLTLKGHVEMITIVLWHPVGAIIGTGSTDNTVRIWDVELEQKKADEMEEEEEEEEDSSKASTKADRTSTILICRHASEADSKLQSVDTSSSSSSSTSNNSSNNSSSKRGRKKQKKSSTDDVDEGAEPVNKKRRTDPETEMSSQLSVVCGAWNTQGTRFASGDYAGCVFIWSDKGKREHQLRQHDGPVSSVRWNSRGNYLLSTGIDGVTILWDIGKAAPKFKFTDHNGPVLDCDWRSDSAFVSCSADKTICLGHTNSNSLRQLSGHTGEVNAVRWDPAGRFLASISDDCTVKLWNTSAECIASAQSHTRGIICLSWSRTGPCTENPELPLMLATGSLDTTVRVWNVQEGVLRCVHTLKHHTHPVVALAFAPDIQPDLLASGSHDRVHIWSVKDGTIVKTFRAPGGGVNSLSWRSSGTQVAAGFSDGSVYIMEINR